MGFVDLFVIIGSFLREFLYSIIELDGDEDVNDGDVVLALALRLKMYVIRRRYVYKVKLLCW